MRLIPAIAVALCLALPAQAQQDQTLADIRAELGTLYGQVQALKAQLDPTGALAANGLTGDTVLDRVIAIDKALQVLTARTEELEFRVGQIVADGTNRVGDLEFRLCELEPGCDIGTLGETPMLGGEAPAVPLFAAPSADQTQGLALTEKSDFERAQAAFEAEDYEGAADLFKTFLSTYPGGPLGVNAQLGLGQSLELSGQSRLAAQAYLEAFSLNPAGSEAPFALFKLAQSLAAIGQVDEACVMLGEVGRRFPQSDAAISAEDDLARLGCQ
jgi:tol-pal system protein YbgF